MSGIEKVHQGWEIFIDSFYLSFAQIELQAKIFT